MRIFSRLKQPGDPKKIRRSQLEIETTKRLRERGAEGDFSPIRMALHYTGTVQGVGFRYTCMSLATKRNLTGWVKNIWDGSVDAEVQGPSVQISALMDNIQASFASWGTPNICLEGAEEIALVEDETSFEVRY